MLPNKIYDKSLSIAERISHLSPTPSECSIFRVHNQLRSVNEKAYKPVIVAIGPYHPDEESRQHLQMMEEHKLRYLRVLVQRKKESVDKYIDAMRSLEPRARRCYAEPIDLDEMQLAKMMVLDGCFIIELLRRFSMHHLREKNDIIFQMDWILNSLQRDLMLFENQLPFFVLCALFDMIEIPNNHRRLIYLTLHFFHDILSGGGFRGTVDGDSQHNIKHLLGLIHDKWNPSLANTEKKKSRQM